MTFTDSLNYIALGNPVSKAIISGTTSLFSRGKSNVTVSGVQTSAIAASEMSRQALKAALPSLHQLAGRNYNFVRIAGLSGASAVILGAIGSHSLLGKDKTDEKTIFETANRFHFFHSLALMGAPFAKYPILTGILMFSGTLLFCGTLYYRAITGEKTLSRYAPIGGSCLIMAWLTFLL